MSFILFYSNYCKHSLQFIKILEKSGEANFFVKICVDKDRTNGLRPRTVSNYGITEVPTIIVNNNKLPGYSAFAWLQKRIDNNNVSSIASRHQKQPMNMHQIANQPQRQEELQGYTSGNSLFGADDNFVDISTGQNQNNGHIYTPSDESDLEAMKGNLILRDDNITGGAILNDDPRQQGNVSTVTGLPSITVNKDKLKSKQLDNAYNKMMQDRENSVPKPQPRF